MAGHDMDSQVLGQSEAVIHTTEFADLVAATDRMVAQATRTIRILSHDTEPALYNREPLANLVAGFIARRSKVARIQLLINDPRPAERETHRLVTLWHRFPTFIEVRELRDEYAKTREALLIVDETGLIRRPEYESPAAVVTFRNLNTARDRAAWFDEAFSRGAPCNALRRLHL